MTIWVVAADSVRARVFTTQSGRGPLTEVKDLVHPESRMPEKDLVSDASGSGRSTGAGGHTFGVANQARNHEVECFAKEVASMLCEANGQGHFDRLHVLAAPAFLGHLRPHLDHSTRARLSSELDLSVTHETPAQIRARLPARI